MTISFFWFLGLQLGSLLHLATHKMYEWILQFQLLNASLESKCFWAKSTLVPATIFSGLALHPTSFPTSRSLLLMTTFSSQPSSAFPIYPRPNELRLLFSYTSAPLSTHFVPQLPCHRQTSLFQDGASRSSPIPSCSPDLSLFLSKASPSLHSPCFSLSLVLITVRRITQLGCVSCYWNKYTSHYCDLTDDGTWQPLHYKKETSNSLNTYYHPSTASDTSFFICLFFLFILKRFTGMYVLLSTFLLLFLPPSPLSF